MKRIIFILCLSALTQGCLQTENSNSGDGDAYGEISGSPQFIAARAIFTANCTPCHSYNAQTEDELIASGLLVPGDSNNSPIYNRLRNSSGPGNKNMPPSGPLSTENLTAISTWVTGVTP